jgi:hypothetical protein
MKKGIFIVAVGSPYYGRLAYNLATTIKSVEEIPIAILHSGRALSHLTDIQTSIFDYVIEDDAATDLHAGAKLLSYEKSPFDKTLLIDADNLWLPAHKPSDLFEKLDGVKFTAITEGYYDIETKEDNLSKSYPLWANIDDIIKTYKLKRGKVYQWRSEMMYFEKSDVARSLFKQAKEIFLKPKIKVQSWGKSIPDEFALNVSAALNGIDPHEFNWQPSFWARRHQNKNVPLHKMMNDHYVLSSGGNFNTVAMTKTYNQLAAVAHKKLGLQFLFLLPHKRDSLVERSKF